MKAIGLISIISILFSHFFSQNFHLYQDNEFNSRKVSILKLSPDSLELKCFLDPSERCACESFEIYKLSKNQDGDYVGEVYGNSTFIKAHCYEGKIKSIIIKNNRYYHCCELMSGIYLIKPTPPSGSKTTPKLTMVNAVPKKFLDYWETFKSRMNNSDSILQYIDFPYAVKCNYLDVTQVSLNEFQEMGVDVFVNGNAFIGNAFFEGNYPKNKGLFFSRILYFEEGTIPYLNDEFNSFFNHKFENLDEIYMVADLTHYFEEGGYKAYFRASNGSFQFIGFEGMEQGD